MPDTAIPTMGRAGAGRRLFGGWIPGPRGTRPLEIPEAVNAEARRSLVVDRRRWKRLRAAAQAVLDGRIVGVSDPALGTEALILAAAALAANRTPVHVIALSAEKAAACAHRAMPFLASLSLRSAVLPDEADFDTRVAAYRHPIVFGSLKRFAQDRLRDRLEAKAAADRGPMVVRRLAGRNDIREALIPQGVFGLVDDADILMIQSPRPVRFSDTSDPSAGRIYADQAFAILSMLERGRHYEVDLATMRIRLTDTGRERLETYAVLFGGAWTDPDWRETTIHAAIAVRDLFRKAEDYDVVRGEIRLNRGVPRSGIEPSLPELISVKEGLRSQAGLPHMTDTRSIFRSYEKLGGVGIGVKDFARDFREAFGLKIRQMRDGSGARRPDIFADRGALVAALGRLDHDPKTTWIWAPDAADAENLPPDLGRCACLTGEGVFAAVGQPGTLVQVGAAPMAWERRIRACFPDAGLRAVASPEDGIFRDLDTPGPAVTAFRARPDAGTYRAAQREMNRAAEQRRKALLGSERYFSNILRFAGDVP